MPISMTGFRGSPAEWDSLIARLPHPHLLQTWEWARVKEAYGWQSSAYIWKASAPAPHADLPPARADSNVVAAAMVLKRKLIRGGLAAHLSILYAPKGPLLDWADSTLRHQVLNDLQRLAQREGAVFLKVDPDVELGRGYLQDHAALESDLAREVTSDLSGRRWLFSRDQIQFRNTVLIDLSMPAAELLSRMKQKTRYNIRLAERKGVVVRAGTPADLPMLYRMYAQTSNRDGFVIRNERYYRTVWQIFMQDRANDDQPSAEPLIAEVDGQPVAALFIFYFARRAYYLYGMSSELHRDRMPNHLLQWTAMQRAIARGCTVYDLWGAPDEMREDDPMWGVFRFKEGLGGELVRTLGAWDYPAARFWYPVYTRLVPRLLDIMRARGRQQTRQDLAGA